MKKKKKKTFGDRNFSTPKTKIVSKVSISHLTLDKEKNDIFS